jgi:hypothetical protein
LPQLFYYSGDAIHGQIQYQADTTSGGNTGSAFMLGGLIIKCGKFSNVGAASSALMYNNADTPVQGFPNKTLCVMVTSATAGVGVAVQDGSLFPQQFTLLKTTNAPTTIFFIAVGY